MRDGVLIAVGIGVGAAIARSFYRYATCLLLERHAVARSQSIALTAELATLPVSREEANPTAADGGDAMEPMAESPTTPEERSLALELEPADGATEAGREDAGLELATHNRYSYSAITQRGDYSWPGGKRLAVYFAINLEHFEFGKGMGAKLGGHFGEPDVLNYSWRDYGNRVGVWRMLELFDSLELPMAVLANASIYRYCPSVMDAFRARGAEVVAHGRTNSEAQGALSEEEEQELITATTAEILKHEAGESPRGWLGPWISQSTVTPDLLAEAGYTYHLDWCHDDQPTWFKCRPGPGTTLADGGDAGENRWILSVPYQQEINDIPHTVARQGSSIDFATDAIDAFDELLEQSTTGGKEGTGQPLVFGLALHPYIVGQPHRLRQLRRVLSHIKKRSEESSAVWMTTPGAVAKHAVKVLEPPVGATSWLDASPT